MRASASKKSLHASEQDRPDVARRRAQWKKYQGRLDPARLVFIDETWAKTNMTRTHGRAPRGERLVAKSPARPLAHADVPGRVALRSIRCSLRHRWPDQWRKLPSLCRAGAGAGAQARRH